jgi:trk system potassium uptake protein TrkH
MVRLFAVLNVLGLVTGLLGASLLLPLGVALHQNDGAADSFGAAAVAAMTAGAALWAATRAGRDELQPRDGFLLVSLLWTVLPVFAAVPLLAELRGLTFVDAYFEAVSGLTTTGASVLSGLDRLPVSINVWRTQLVWLGGMGILVLAVAVLPLLGVGGAQIFRAETPGPMRETRLTPRINETARGLWFVYGGLSLACLLAYRTAGMSWLDALMHAFSTLGLGAFTPHDGSFGYFDSPRIELVAVVFMTLAGLNFGTHFLAWQRRSLGVYRHDLEAIPYLVLLAGCVVGIAVYLWVLEAYPAFPTALRHSAFNVVSMATTAGFHTVDFAAWPVFAPLAMLFLCTFVTCSGSTGGGIKLLRAQLQVKQAARELKRIVHPRAYIPVKLGNVTIENNIVFAVLGFMLVYGAVLVVATLLLALSGLDAVSSVSAVLACLNNTGPGLEKVGPTSTYQFLSDFQKWVCTATMLLGRLEVFALVVVFTPSFWRQ